MQVQLIQPYNSAKTYSNKNMAQSFGTLENIPQKPKETFLKVAAECGSEIGNSLKKGLKKTAKIISEKLAKLAEDKKPPQQ